MPPPSIAPRSAPRGNSFIGIQRSNSVNSATAGQPPNDSALPGERSGEAPVPQSQRPPSPDRVSRTSHASRPVDGGDESRHAEPLPSTHSPHIASSSVGPASVPLAGSDQHAPGSGVYVKRKVKKSSSNLGDTPQPSSDRRRSPTRAGSEGASTPGRPKSILRNPIARHSTVTFSADTVGVTMAQVEAIPVLKKSDVEQATLRDEVFASLCGPVTSKEQITVNITVDDDGQGVRIEGIIDHLRNSDEQTAVIRRLADFLHSPNVFGKSLAPFLTLSGAIGAADRTLNDAIQRILVREARINDVPIKTVAPSAKALGAAPNTPKLSSGKGGQSVTTPHWNPDAPVSLPEQSQAVERHERRRKAYQSSLGILYASPLALPTPHHGRWERAQNEPYVVRPDPPQDDGPLLPAQPASLRIDVETPRTPLSGSRGYTLLPHGIVDSPTRANSSMHHRFPTASQTPVLSDGHRLGSAGSTPSHAQPSGRLLSRDPPLSYGGSLSRNSLGGTPAHPGGGATVYRTRQYVKE